MLPRQIFNLCWPDVEFYVRAVSSRVVLCFSVCFARVVQFKLYLPCGFYQSVVVPQRFLLHLSVVKIGVQRWELLPSWINSEHPLS